MPNSEFPRRYLRPEDHLGEWSRIEPYFDELERRPLESAAAVERWLVDASELRAGIDEIGSDRYVKMTCQTDDPARERAYLNFVEHIVPRCKPRRHALNTKFVGCAHARDLPRARYHVYDRGVRNDVDLFREENVPLQVEESKLSQQFQKTSGAMMVQFDGREQTLQQLGVYGERVERDVRQAAWEAGSRRRLQDAEALEDIFDALLALRHRIALNTGAADYREYIFKAMERFDYTPQDCLRFHDTVERCVVPLMRAMQLRRKSELRLETLRPWDLAVDVKGRPPLRPFKAIEELIGQCSTIFHRVDTELGAQFEEMHAKGYLDLESRKGKAPGGYQTTYEEARHPFIFMNAVGLQRDVETLIHEGGHAFHAYACRHDPLLAYRSAPLEFAEVASMGMEMMAYEHLDVLYRGEDLARARRKHLEGVVTVLPWVATIDAFQHWMYTHPRHTRAERRATWLDLRRRFGGVEEFEGYERELALFWQRQLHLFQVPFYYIEYGIAQLGALQLWCNYRRDSGEAVRAYRRALALGGSRPLPELFAEAGLRFDFSEGTIRPLIAGVQAELAALA